MGRSDSDLFDGNEGHWIFRATPTIVIMPHIMKYLKEKGNVITFQGHTALVRSSHGLPCTIPTCITLHTPIYFPEGLCYRSGHSCDPILPVPKDRSMNQSHTRNGGLPVWYCRSACTHRNSLGREPHGNRDMTVSTHKAGPSTPQIHHIG